MCTLTTQSWNQDMHRIKMKRYSIETELQPEALTGEEVASVGPRSMLALLECEEKKFKFNMTRCQMKPALPACRTVRRAVFIKHKSDALLQLYAQRKLWAICAGSLRSHFHHNSVYCYCPQSVFFVFCCFSIIEKETEAFCNGKWLKWFLIISEQRVEPKVTITNLDAQYQLIIFFSTELVFKKGRVIRLTERSKQT